MEPINDTCRFYWRQYLTMLIVLDLQKQIYKQIKNSIYLSVAIYRRLASPAGLWIADIGVSHWGRLMAWNDSRGGRCKVFIVTAVRQG